MSQKCGLCDVSCALPTPFGITVVMYVCIKGVSATSAGHGPPYTVHLEPVPSSGSYPISISWRWWWWILLRIGHILFLTQSSLHEVQLDATFRIQHQPRRRELTTALGVRRCLYPVPGEEFRHAHPGLYLSKPHTWNYTLQYNNKIKKSLFLNQLQS